MPKLELKNTYEPDLYKGGKQPDNYVLHFHNAPDDIVQSLSSVVYELDKAVRKFKPFSSDHEAYAIILEELDEMWDEIKKNNTSGARKECIQVCAMALRYLVDSYNDGYRGQKTL